MTKLKHPIDILQLMAEKVDPDDECVHCGWQFGYELEGCDECLIITEVLEATDRTFKEER